MKNFKTLAIKMQLLDVYQEHAVNATCEFLEVCSKVGLKKVGIGYFNKEHFKTSRSYVETFFPSRIEFPGVIENAAFGDGFFYLDKKKKQSKYQKIWQARNIYFTNIREYFSQSGNRGQAYLYAKKFILGIYAIENNKWVLIES